MARVKLSAAERSRRYRQKKKLLLNQTPEELANKRSACLRQQRRRGKLTVEEKKEIACRQKRYRERISHGADTEDATAGSTPNIAWLLRTPYRCANSAAKAVKKAKAALPSNESYRKYVWQRIGLECGYLEAKDIREDEGRSPTMIEHQHRLNMDQLHERIQQFFLRRDISYTTPGMSNRDHVIVRTPAGKEKLKKHFLTMFLREAFSVFKDENPAESVSFSVFCHNRPANVLLLKETPQHQCLCIKHANFQMTLSALGVDYNESFWKNVLCDASVNSLCWQQQCLDCKNGQKFTHNKDLAEKVNRCIWKKDTRKRLQRITEDVTAETVYEETINMWEMFVQHVNLKRVQFEEYKKDQRGTRIRILNVDFAMNFTAEAQEEVQSALWSRSSIVLFTAAVEMDGLDQSILLASDCKTKDKTSVFAFLSKIYSHLKDVSDKNIQEVIWSDGAASEFKNQYMLCILRYFATKYQKVFTWKFFCTSHGKGKCDAIGGKAKLTVRQKLLAQGDRISTVNNAADFVRIAQDNLPSVTVMEVTEREMEQLNAEHKLWEKSAPYSGIKNMHIFEVQPNGLIKSARNAIEFD